MSVVSTIIAIVLSWGGALIALGFLWEISLAYHHEWMSLWILFWFLAATYVGFDTTWTMVLLMLGTPRRRAHRTWGLLFLVMSGITWFGARETWERTEGPFVPALAFALGLSDKDGSLPLFEDWWKAHRANMALEEREALPDSPIHDEFHAYSDLVNIEGLTKTDLREATLTKRPGNWKPFPIWLADSRGREIDPDAVPSEDDMARWRIVIEALEAPHLSDADLRAADMAFVFAPGADLRGARLQGVDLQYAQLQGAALQEAHLQKADLRFAFLQGADLSRAEMQGADLRNAEMQRAKFIEAKLQHTELGAAKLQGADFHNARLDVARAHGRIATKCKLLPCGDEGHVHGWNAASRRDFSSGGSRGRELLRLANARCDPSWYRYAMGELFRFQATRCRSELEQLETKQIH